MKLKIGKLYKTTFNGGFHYWSEDLGIVGQPTWDCKNGDIVVFIEIAEVDRVSFPSLYDCFAVKFLCCDDSPIKTIVVPASMLDNSFFKEIEL